MSDDDVIEEENETEGEATITNLRICDKRQKYVTKKRIPMQCSSTKIEKL